LSLRAGTVDRVHDYWRGWEAQGDASESVSVVMLGSERFVRAPDRLRDLLVARRPEDLESLRVLLGDDIEQAVEVRLAYIDDRSRLAATDGVLDISDGDPRLAAAKAESDPLEWSESSVDDPCENRFGVVEPGGLVSVSTVRVWADRLGHIGVFTAAPARGRGLGARVGAAAAERAFALGVVPQWRSRIDNPASERVADSLGFVGLGRQLFVRLRARS
jgi:RimJ/RimL family protein N-acetyltransferase